MLSARSLVRAQRGFSLIEMMVSLVVGLILIGSVVALIASNIQANAQNIAATRLTQELRAVTEIVTAELRRARYQNISASIVGVGIPAPPSVKSYQDVTVTDNVGSTNDNDGIASTTDGDCIQYAYQALDSSGNPSLINAGDANDDCRAISLGTDANGVNAAFINGAPKGAPPAVCGNTPRCGTGRRLTTPQVNLTQLSFNFDSNNDTVVVTVEGALVSDPNLRRRYTEIVRIPSAAIP